MRKKRRIWLIAGVSGLLVLLLVFGFLLLTSTPFRFLSGSKLVSYKASEPSSHSGSSEDYFQRIFEIDRAMVDVLKDVRKELPQTSGWVETSWEEGTEFTFHKGDEFVVVMPHASDAQGTAVVYVRNASRIESWLKTMLYKVPDRYDEWQ